MRILVTGGTGFIGYNVSKNLIEKGYEVGVITRRKVLDNTMPFYLSAAKYFNSDLRDFETLKLAFNEFKPEIVSHHAGSVGIGQPENNVASDAEDNIIGSINLFDLSVKYNVRKIIFASTSAVYGTPSTIPIRENINLKPLTPYGISKLSTELYLDYYKEAFKLERVILRYGNVYGNLKLDNSSFKSVVDLFLQKALKGEVLLLSCAEETRDFIYIKDIVAANMLAIEGGERGIYNIGSGVEVSLISVVEIISEILGKKLLYINEFGGNWKGKRFVLDISKAKNELRFIPKYLLSEGVKEMVEHVLEERLKFER